MGFDERFELIARERAVFVRVGFVKKLVEARPTGRAGLSSALLTSSTTAPAPLLRAALFPTTLSAAALLAALGGVALAGSVMRGLAKCEPDRQR
jgi:hypothetical protein